MHNFKDEEKIIAAMTQRDEKALRSFYRQCEKPLHAYIYRKISSHHVAEEIVQDVMFDFMEHLRDFRGDSSLKTFLFSIARNKTVDYIRKKKIKKILFSALPSYIVEGLTTVMFDDGLEKKELSSKIKHILEKLPNDYRVILRLKYMEGERVGSIAEKMSMNFKATESLLFRARRAFIKLFKKNP